MGVAEGFNSVVNAYNLKLKREEYRLNAAKTKAALYQEGFDENGNPTELAVAKHDNTLQQLKQQQQQIQKMNSYIIKRDTHDAITAATGTGNWDGLNALFKVHPELKNTWQVENVRNINFNNNSDINLLKSYGLDDKTIGLLQKDPVKAKEFMQQHFIATLPDGTTALKDAQKVAAVAGVSPARFDVYNMAFKNSLKTQSDVYEASKGTYGSNNANIKLTDTKSDYYNQKEKESEITTQKTALSTKGVILDNLSKKIKLQDTVEKEEIMNNLPKLTDSIVKFNPNKVDPTLFRQAKVIQGNSRLPETLYNKIEGTVTALKTGKSLLTQLDNTKVDLNAFDKARKAIMSALPSDWAKLSPDERKQALDRVKLDASMGEWITKYVQAISGAAVTDDEFTRHFKDAFGGKTFTNTSTVKTAFKTYLNALSHNADSMVNNIAGDYPYTALNFKKSYYNAKPEESNAKPKLSDIFGGNK